MARSKSTAILTSPDATGMTAPIAAPGHLPRSSQLQRDMPGSSSVSIPSASRASEAAMPAAAGGGGPGLGLMLSSSSRTSSVYLARRDFSALDHAFSTVGSKGASGAASDRRLSAQGSLKYTRSLYLAGLRGMLSEMRGVRPPGTPAGHTQELTLKLTAGQARYKVCGQCWHHGHRCSAEPACLTLTDIPEAAS